MRLFRIGLICNLMRIGTVASKGVQNGSSERIHNMSSVTFCHPGIKFRDGYPGACIPFLPPGNAASMKISASP